MSGGDTKEQCPEMEQCKVSGQKIAREFEARSLGQLSSSVEVHCVSNQEAIRCIRY